MKREYITQRQGKDFVLYEGLLDQAHQEGLRRISTSIYQVPTDANGNVAIVKAEVETSKGVFSGIGDASPANVNRNIAPHLLRMAETRAKARALRDAVNVAEAAIEELGDEPDDAHGPAYDSPKASPHKPASANQLATISKLARLVGAPELDDGTASLNALEASERITELSQRYTALKGGAGRADPPPAAVGGCGGGSAARSATGRTGTRARASDAAASSTRRTASAPAAGSRTPAGGATAAMSTDAEPATPRERDIAFIYARWSDDRTLRTRQIAWLRQHYSDDDLSSPEIPDDVLRTMAAGLGLPVDAA